MLMCKYNILKYLLHMHTHIHSMVDTKVFKKGQFLNEISV